MSDRISLTTSEALTTQYNDLRTDIDGLKLNQRVGGRAMATYLTRTTASYSISKTFAANEVHYYINTFTASVQSYPFAQLTYQVWIDNPTTEIHPDNARWPLMDQVTLPPDPANPKVVQWRVRVVAPSSGSYTYYFKWYVLATDAGTIS